MINFLLKAFLQLIAGISILSTLLFGYLFYERSNMDYGPEGTYHDGIVVYHIQAMEFYGFLFFFSLIVLIILIFLIRKVFKA